jgi:glycosyltransferase involved in cell wall biosynthesis
VEGPVKVYVSGSLFLQKGLKQILAAVEAMEDVQIVAAGPFYDRFAKEEFANHPKVVYNGIVTARRSLELAAECDAIFAFYAPTKSLEFTSPNKIYDALCVGRPAIINREVDVAPWIMENGLGMQCAYEDVEALREIIASLRDRRGGLSEYSERLRAMFAKGYSWERMEERLEYVYRNPKTAARELDKVLGARSAATAGRQA